MLPLWGPPVRWAKNFAEFSSSETFRTRKSPSWPPPDRETAHSLRAGTLPEGIGRPELSEGRRGSADVLTDADREVEGTPLPAGLHSPENSTPRPAISPPSSPPTQPPPESEDPDERPRVKLVSAPQEYTFVRPQGLDALAMWLLLDSLPPDRMERALVLLSAARWGTGFLRAKARVGISKGDLDLRLVAKAWLRSSTASEGNPKVSDEGDSSQRRRLEELSTAWERSWRPLLEAGGRTESRSWTEAVRQNLEGLLHPTWIRRPVRRFRRLVAAAVLSDKRIIKGRRDLVRRSSWRRGVGLTLDVIVQVAVARRLSDGRALQRRGQHELVVIRRFGIGVVHPPQSVAGGHGGVLLDPDSPVGR